jgi:hypothetical protein
MKKVSGTQYENLAKKVVSIYTENNVKLLGHFDNYGLNEFYKSEDVLFVFNWGIIDHVSTPIGLISFGSILHSGNCAYLAEKELLSYFGLEFKSGNNETSTYKATKNLE